MLACPYCDQPATSHLKKLTLSEFGAADVVSCKACRRRVGASRWNLVVLLPFVYSVSFFDDLPLPWFVAMILGEVGLYTALKMWVIPLARRHDEAVPARRH